MGVVSYYAHKKTILLEKSKLLAITEDLTKVMNLLSNTDVMGTFTRQRARTDKKFYELKNFTIRAAILNKIPEGCKDTVLNRI